MSYFKRFNLITIKCIFSTTFKFVGFFWFFIEVLTYIFGSLFADFIKPHVWGIFTILSLIALLIELPKVKISCKLRDKDNYIEIQITDAIKIRSTLVVPVNNKYDMSMSGNVMRTKSLLKQVIVKFFHNKPEYLQNDINDRIQKKEKYDIGQVVEVEKDNRSFLFIVNSKVTKNNTVKSNYNDFLDSLNGLWRYLAEECSRKNEIVLPLINTQHCRVENLNRSIAIKDIIESYIEISKKSDIVDKLIICILPKDINHGKIDLNEIEEYLKFKCNNYRIVSFNKKQKGSEYTPSSVSNISANYEKGK
ncbi:MAG: DUF6430 domain-containing protein [Candidatus Stygibacter australis]|nr:DUF6430 domain-containing protein [Candidatus Stygibacter australis]